MWFEASRDRTECGKVQDALERSFSREQSEAADALGTLLAGLPSGAREHASACGDCRHFAQELLAVRRMLASESAGAEPGPYFLSRVMAAISDREAQLEKSTQTWAAVPRLAYRLSVLASLSLLVAASWLYQQPNRASVARVSATQSTEGLVEGSGASPQDDFLLNTAEREQ